MREIGHIFRLGLKELLSLFRDPVLLFLIAYSFTFSGREARTPLYDYNQMLYRLDLDDPRLKPAQE